MSFNINTNMDCYRCGKIFGNEYDRLLHAKFSHKKIRRFKCEKCFKLMINRKELISHIRRVHVKKRQNTFACKICNAVLTASQLIFHIKLTHANVRLTSATIDSFKCEICFKELLDKERYRTHTVEVVNEGEKKKCAFCHRLLFQECNPNDHMNAQHSKVQRYKCEKCLQVFKKKKLIGHIREMHVVKDPDKFQCTICNMVFILCRDVIIHIRLIHANSKQTCFVMDMFGCEVCHKMFPDNESKQQHFTSHPQGNPDKNVPITSGEIPTEYLTDKQNGLLSIYPETRNECQICHELFVERDQLYSHAKSFHLISKPFQCEICHLFFESCMKLRSHMLSHQNITLHECKFCLEVFPEVMYLNKHAISHTTVIPHSCHICLRLFSQKKFLDDHVLVTHTLKNQYECEICHETFVLKMQLDKHVVSHERAAWHECENCHELFSLKSYLDEHKLIHVRQNFKQCNICYAYFSLRNSLAEGVTFKNEVESHNCEICEAVFSCESKFSEHEKVHTETVPQACDLCHKLFSLKKYRDRHRMVAHTGEKPHNCEICLKAFSLERQIIQPFPTCTKNIQCDEKAGLVLEFGFMNDVLVSHLEQNPHRNEVCDFDSLASACSDVIIE